MKIRPAVALGAGRASGSLSRVLGLGGGTSLPGAVALKIDPGIIKTLAERLSQGNVVLTATNGKTTTANMLAAIVAKAGFTAVHNTAGANLAFGVAAALMVGGGRSDQPKVGLFEVDEAVVRNIAADLNPKILIVGNIFRDQLDRFGEVDNTARLIGEGINRLNPGAKLVLNADDPRVAALGAGREPLYFGIEDQHYAHSGPFGAQDSKDCLVCGARLKYARRFFSHLGHYSCTSCGFKRPKATVVATELELSLAGSRFNLATPVGDVKVNLPVPAVYNIYNALAAAAGAVALGVGLGEIAAALNEFKAAFGRFEVVNVNGRRLHLMLIKNPTGFNQAIVALGIEAGPKNVMIAINDNLADGTDVSWLWDADVEQLGPTSFLMAAGVRAYDMALRLKYAGRPAHEFSVEPDFDKALGEAITAVPKGHDLYILPTYTAMLELRRRLERLGHTREFWRPEARS